MKQLRTTRPASGALAVSVTVAALVACWTPDRGGGARGGSGDVVIGVAWPWAAHPEIRLANGLEMAVDEVNRSGGVLGRTLRIRREDDGESVDSGRIVAERLGADPHVVAVIGHLQSYVTIPAAAIYDAHGIVLVAPTSTDPELTAHGYRRVFRTTFTNEAIGWHMADYAAVRGYRRIVIYYVRDGYGRGVANAFEERASDRHITVLARQSYDPDGSASEDAFGRTFNEWKHLGADAMFVAGEVPLAGTLVAQARRTGLTLPVIGVDAMGSAELMTVGGAAVEGVVVPTVFHPDEGRADVRQFTAAFSKRYGVRPDAGSALGYDAVWLLARAIRAAGSAKPDDIARVIHGERDWEGVTGALRFAANGDLVDRPLEKMVVRVGRFEYLADSNRVPRAVASR